MRFYTKRKAWKNMLIEHVNRLEAGETLEIPIESLSDYAGLRTAATSMGAVASKRGSVVYVSKGELEDVKLSPGAPLEINMSTIIPIVKIATFSREKCEELVLKCALMALKRLKNPIDPILDDPISRVNSNGDRIVWVMHHNGWIPDVKMRWELSESEIVQVQNDFRSRVGDEVDFLDYAIRFYATFMEVMFFKGRYEKTGDLAQLK